MFAREEEKEKGWKYKGSRMHMKIQKCLWAEWEKSSQKDRLKIENTKQNNALGGSQALQ